MTRGACSVNTAEELRTEVIQHWDLALLDAVSDLVAADGVTRREDGDESDLKVGELAQMLGRILS